MDPGRVVFDISSDEESSEPKGEDFDWLAAFLDSEDKETFDDDSDDVVVVAEVKPKLKSNSKSSKSMPVKDVDDDCVILDGDPDKTAGVVDDSPDGGGEDDLLVVGETGQLHGKLMQDLNLLRPVAGYGLRASNPVCWMRNFPCCKVGQRVEIERAAMA